MFNWPEYGSVHDTADILLAEEERTYVLIENMFKTLRECYKTEHVNIGMDEAHTLGLGKYLDKHGYHGRFEILLKHLKKVCEIAEKYGFKPAMWSDMFIRIANNENYYPETVKPIPDEIKRLVPNNVGLIYWDYYHTEGAHYDKMIDVHKGYNRDVWFAGGAWSWTGFAPRNAYSLQSMQHAMISCREKGIKNVFITMWGDNGKECSFYSLLPALFAIRKYYEGETDENKIKAEFTAVTGEDYDAFFMLDLLNKIPETVTRENNLSKYSLYNDPFNGFLDSAIPVGAGEEYKKLGVKLAKYARKGEYAYIFDSSSKLCDLLSVKAELGVLTRKAYKAKDTDGLKDLILSYKKAECNLEIFYKAFKKLWFIENKPQGFDTQDLRLGGLKQRLRSCRERLEEYVDGKIKNIPELEEEMLNYYGLGHDELLSQPIMFNQWNKNVTQNIL
jgi:hypothetical protein